MSYTKLPSDADYYGYDFTSQLGAASIVSITSVSQTVLNGSGSLTQGSTSISGKQVLVFWSGGSAASDYLTKVVITDSSAVSLEVDGVFLVRSSPSSGSVSPTAETYGGLRSRIADEMQRPDLVSQIPLAVADAIKEAATNSFWFNEVRGLTFNMVAGQSFYDASALASIPWLGRIDALWIIASGQRRNLEMRNALDLEAWREGTDTLGEPYAYARQGNGLAFWMFPSQPFPVYIDGTSRFAPLVNDTDTNPWTDEGGRYIRALAKAHLWEDVVRDFDEADRQWQKAEREKQILLRETGGRLASGLNRAFL